MKAVTDTKYYDEIAYNIGIYGKSGLKPSEMAEEVVRIARDRENYGEERGREAEQTAFWEAFQNHGEPVQYFFYRLFHGSNWTDEVYNPIYPLDASVGSYGFSLTFFSSYITNTKVPMMAEGLKMNSCFKWSHVKTIPLLVVNEATTDLNNAFVAAYYLENITIEGTVAMNIAFPDSSKLTSAIVDSIIGALKQLTPDDGAKTLTLHSTVKNKLTATQIATIQTKGWTLA